MKKIIGISGSPVPNSNTDRLILQMLKASGLEYEFIKLSSLDIRPCRACKRCAKDNICKFEDDFQELAKKISMSDAMIIAAYTPYEMIDAFTKAFMERLWSMRHVKGLNKGKIIVTAVSSLAQKTALSVLNSMTAEINKERMNHVAQLSISGNVPCLTCGFGDGCDYSGVKKLYGPEAKASADMCIKVEEEPVWEEATELAKKIGLYLSGEDIELPRVAAN